MFLFIRYLVLHCLILDNSNGLPLIFGCLDQMFSSEHSLEGLMLNLKLQCFGPLMRRAGSLEKTPMLGRLKAGGEGDDIGWDSWIVSLMWWTWVWVGSGSWWWTGKPGMLQSMGSQRVAHNWATELNWQWWLQYYIENIFHYNSKRLDLIELWDPLSLHIYIHKLI